MDHDIVPVINPVSRQCSYLQVTAKARLAVGMEQSVVSVVLRDMSVCVLMGSMEATANLLHTVHLNPVRMETLVM